MKLTKTEQELMNEARKNYRNITTVDFGMAHKHKSGFRRKSAALKLVEKGFLTVFNTTHHSWRNCYYNLCWVTCLMLRLTESGK